MPTAQRLMLQIKKKAQISGYITYAAECRKEIQNQNPDLSFGEISKIVGAKVRIGSSVIPLQQCHTSRAHADPHEFSNVLEFEHSI